jgi:hypothetical protein
MARPSFASAANSGAFKGGSSFWSAISFAIFATSRFSGLRSIDFSGWGEICVERSLMIGFRSTRSGRRVAMFTEGGTERPVYRRFVPPSHAPEPDDCGMQQQGEHEIRGERAAL